MTNDRRAFVSLGAGVQSTVLLLLADRGKILPRPEAAIFADTKWEPAAVYTHLDWLENEVSVPVYRVSGGDLYKDAWDGVDARGHTFTLIPAFARMPDNNIGLMVRRCTTRYKIEPSRRQIRALVGRSNKTKVQMMMGITTDEAHRVNDSKVQWLVNTYPLIDLGLTRAMCLAWFRQEYPGRPLVKSSCVGCPFHADADWLRLAKDTPAQMDEAIVLDERLRDPERPRHSKDRGGMQYLHKSAQPLGNVIEHLAHIDSLGQQMDFGDAFANECMGVCAV